MAVYVGTKSHFQSLANNCSSNRRVSFVNLYFLISHFPQHKEEEGWKTTPGPSNLHSLLRWRRRADPAERGREHGAWWALILQANCSASSSLWQDCFDTLPGCSAHSGKSFVGKLHERIPLGET